MTTIHLVRHAVHPLVDRVLVGRTSGVQLGKEGREQAKALARRLAREGIGAVQSSPRERALETAALIAAPLGLTVDIVPDLDEADFGQWAGRSFDELNRDPRWVAWNNERGTARPPGGETMLELQKRILGHLDRLQAQKPKRKVVLVSHAELIRAALLHFLGIALDGFARIEIAPASISTLLLNGSGAKVIGCNDR